MPLPKTKKKDRFKILEKLHRQFSYPRSDKIVKKKFSHPSGYKMVDKNTGTTDRLLKMFYKLPSTCDICIKYTEKPRPVVIFPLAT